MVIRQSGTQRDYPDEFRCLLNLTDSTADNGFKDGTTGIVKQMNLVDNDELDKINIGAFTRFAGHNIPLFRCGDNDLRLVNLLLCKMGVTCQFTHLDPVISQPLLEITDDLSDQSLHWRNINDLECFGVDSSILLSTLAQCL